MSGEAGLIEYAYPYMIVDSEMEDWGRIFKLAPESSPSCKPVRLIKGPTLVLRTQGGTSLTLNRWIVLQTINTPGVTPDET